MKLKIYNRHTVPSARQVDPTISLNSKTGLVNISSSAAAIIGLNDGDFVCIVQDETSPKDWFMYKSTEEDGFKVRNLKQNVKQVSFNNVTVVRDLYESIKFTDNTTKMRVSNACVQHEGLLLVPIITSSAVKKNNSIHASM